MLGWIAKALRGAASRIEPKTARMMLEKAGIKNIADAAKLTKKELFKKMGVKPKSITKTALKGGTAVGLGAYGANVIDRLKDGGMVKMKRGGSVKKRAKSSSKKSRGTGAAIKGTKFKGVF